MPSFEFPPGTHAANSCCVVQLLKAVKLRPGATTAEIDSEAILLRAYGEGTAILIDRNSRSIVITSPSPQLKDE